MYEIIERLCIEKGIKISKLSQDAQIPRSTFTELKSGRTKKLSTDTLNKVAKYFGVSVDYLLGKTQKEKPIDKADGLINIIADEISSLDNEQKEKLIKLLSNPEKLKAVLSLL